MTQRHRFVTDLEGLRTAQLKEWRIHNVTSLQRSVLGGELSSLNQGLIVYDVDVKKQEKEALERLNKYVESEDDALLVTVSLERLTELLGYVLPKVDRYILKHNEYWELYRYHALEEAEHAHVAVDILHKYRNI